MARIEKAVRKLNVENNSIKNITKWKNYIMEKIVEDEELAKLLQYNNPNCLSSPSVSEEDRYGLVNSRVFGYRFIPEVAEEANTWISMSISGFAPQEGYRQFSKQYLMGNIFFYILVDSKIMETHTGYRQDLIAARIYEIFQSNRDLGIGELRMMTFIENWEHNNKLGGYTIGFETIDFK
jgi:uncharacterized protein YuzB (UPF0349 family)